MGIKRAGWGGKSSPQRRGNRLAQDSNMKGVSKGKRRGIGEEGLCQGSRDDGLGEARGRGQYQEGGVGNRRFGEANGTTSGAGFASNPEKSSLELHVSGRGEGKGTEK